MPLLYFFIVRFKTLKKYKFQKLIDTSYCYFVYFCNKKILSMKYQCTYLWETTLAEKADVNEPQRKVLRESYEKARDNISTFLSKIHHDFPHLTLHDISHIDSLWETASVIIGVNYPISPMEGYILGCSFLIHDAALCYDAFDGVANLRQNITWKDCFADIQLKNNDSIEQQHKDADFWAIRILHAQQSTQILDRNFKRSDESCYYIIEDSTLRDHYKNLIGKIASSHHWDIDEISKLLNEQENIIDGFPREWRINPRKLACIIRCADASHLDSGRAPDYLFKILKLNNVSHNHWKAQNHLSKIDQDTQNEKKIIITSTKNFKEEDFAAWNVAYDAITVLNNELTSSNQLLESIDSRLCFQAKEVTGAYSKTELSKYIRTDGWIPCESNIHISNVVNLIDNFGGSRLYGTEDQLIIVLRELIQNARDAIKAREEYDNGFDEGKIKIEIKKETDGTYITLSDDGLGMSHRTITNCFLNFGTSFWMSDLAKQEFPGLRSSNFLSVGKFGVGFYSVFMVASQVYVASHKYDDALDNTIMLKFPTGLTLSPIVVKIRGKSNESTSVKFKVDATKYQSSYTVNRNQMGAMNVNVPFHKILCAVCAGLDVDVYYQDDEIKKTRIHQNIENENFDKCQWLKDISFAEYQNNPNLIKYIDENYTRLEYIKENNRIVGLAALKTEVQGDNQMSFLGIDTIGGLTSSIHSRFGNAFIGYMDYTENIASRSAFRIKKATNETIKLWTEKQLSSLTLTKMDYLTLPYALCDYNVDPSSYLKALFFDKTKYSHLYNLEEIINQIENGKKIIILKMAHINDHMESHYDLDKIVINLQPEDLFYHPYENGNYNCLKRHNNKAENNFSFIDCLCRKAEIMKCDLIFSEIPHFAPSLFSSTCVALIINKK